MVEQFLAQLNDYDDFRVYCYGSYERAFLKRMRKAAAKMKPVDRVLGALVNVLSAVYAHAYFPCHSNGLKDVAGCLGSSWTDPDASGVQSIAWRKRWEAGRAEEWQRKLLAYNREDCAALRSVTEFLRAAGAGPGQSGGAKPAGEGGPTVTWVEEIDRLGTVNRRGKIQFFHPDYQYINGCARFDYQRQRVFVRTSKVRKKYLRAPQSSRNRTLRVSRRVQIVSRKCPACGSADVIRSAAENAIRQFAYYREATPGRLREAGLRDYLVLLSLYQTCRYKGVSFLKVLRSRERDMDAFCQGRHRSRRPPLIEVYPKGVTRPDFRPLRKEADRPRTPDPAPSRTED
jgi:hypothetical protein